MAPPGDGFIDFLLKQWTKHEIINSQPYQHPPGARAPAGPPRARAGPRLRLAALVILWTLTFAHHFIFESLCLPGEIRATLFALLQVFNFYIYFA